MITADVDMTGFNAGIAALLRSVGATSREIVEKETGELIKTLVRVSPPLRQQKTNQSIAQNLSSKFDQASRVDYIDSRISPGGIKWTGANKQFLYGVANQNDQRKEGDVKKIAALSFRITSKGRTVSDFKRARKRQKVALNRQTYLQAGMLTKVIKYFQKSTGRLKAGWLVSNFAGVIRLSGANLPPKWVTRHNLGAKGRFENNLSTPQNPNFAIFNFAKGIGDQAINSIVASAVSIRAKAMLKNAALYTSGKKNLSDYAR